MMNEEKRLEDICRRINEKTDLDSAEVAEKAREDIIFLLDLLQTTSAVLEKQKKKNDILSQQNLELTQEIENVKGDFGESTR